MCTIVKLRRVRAITRESKIDGGQQSVYHNKRDYCMEMKVAGAYGYLALDYAGETYLPLLLLLCFKNYISYFRCDSYNPYVLFQSQTRQILKIS